jgi:hypothetical protein
VAIPGRAVPLILKPADNRLNRGTGTDPSLSNENKLNEPTMLLAAINCVDLAQEICANISENGKNENYIEQLRIAQQSLVNAGLCTISERGLPILIEDLAQAVFPLAKSDSIGQISGTMGGSLEETAVYIVQGRFLTIYHNYGEDLQLLEYGKIKDMLLHIESMFTDFGVEKDKIY